MRPRLSNLAPLVIPLLLAAAYPLLPEYPKALAARIMTLSIYSYGYAVCFHMIGVMSLGHAALFAAGMYGAGLYTIHVSPDPLMALAAGIASAVSLSLLLGGLAARVRGPYLMIATLLASQTIYLAALHFNEVTGGEQGLVLEREATLVGVFRPLMAEADARYFISLLTLSAAVAGVSLLSASRLGKLFLALRDDEEKLESLGYNTSLLKLTAFSVSGVLSGASGALQALLYSYVGAGYVGIFNSVEPVLWTLVGGPYVQVGPFLGCLLVNVLGDLARGLPRGHVLVVGVGLVAFSFATGRLGWVYRLLGVSRGREE
ncbi:MAG: branched-chain amino acid ABC transporter permease [Nitrososphaerota archaeon]|nr:branched-chain amino acid ABC transporter permease [Candidatus Calditenuaceae archaeon]MDW8073738.1 branched-chain amino acid ABC transporter permease [Nitrososphaerota archaeon]